MKIISTNIGKKQLIQYKGQEVYTGIYKNSTSDGLLLEKTDVKGDDVMDRKYHGGLDKACYIYSSSHYIFWKEKYPELNWQWGMFGENLSVSDLDEANILIGDVYKIGTALVQVTQPRQPCYKLGVRLENPLAVKDFVNAEKPGVYLKVLEEGIVTAGDTMKLKKRNEGNFSIRSIFHLIYHAKENITTLEKAIKMPELAESCKKDLIKYAKR